MSEIIGSTITITGQANGEGYHGFAYVAARFGGVVCERTKKGWHADARKGNWDDFRGDLLIVKPHDEPEGFKTGPRTATVLAVIIR